MGAGVNEEEWKGNRVGVRLVSYSPNLMVHVHEVLFEMYAESGERWLYSSCLNCEICAVNNTSCPYQKNAGAVSQDSDPDCFPERTFH